METTFYRCSYCGRDNFASKRGLAQHQTQNKSCATKMRQKVGEDAGYFAAHETLECLTVMPIARAPSNFEYSSFVAQSARYNDSNNSQQYSSNHQSNETTNYYA